MNSLTDKEINRASDGIDKALSTATRSNRGEVAFRILSVVRNLNDHIAFKIWKDVRPDQKMDINKVASKFGNVRPYQFIARFDHFLRASVSHFTPSEEGAERLMIKYYRYLLQLKKAVYDRYGMIILRNIDMFLEDLDEQTKDYYQKVATEIEKRLRTPPPKNFDNYYIDKIKPFFVNQEIYYEVALEPADEKPNKFNRITAFTKYDISTDYCVALSFSNATISVFNTDFPIKIITEWHVSIRPCELNNFAELLNVEFSVSRGLNEYKMVMSYLEQNGATLVDIIDYDQQEYDSIKNWVIASTQKRHSYIFDMLDICREISASKRDGANIIRYLLYRMNNRIIKDQQAHGDEKRYAGLNISSKCMPFDRNPYSFNPKGHISNLYDLFECIDTAGHKGELLSRYIEKNTNQNGVLFTPIDQLTMFGIPQEIEQTIEKYNRSLYSGFRPASELGVFKDYVYSKGCEIATVQIINKLEELADNVPTISSSFSEKMISQLKLLPAGQRLDDEVKEQILKTLFSESAVHLIYGAAGTGKTTLVNHISKLLEGKKKIYLAKTNPAVENLRRKVTCCDRSDEFTTIDKFVRSGWYETSNYDLVVVDECSTVKNEDILKVINRAEDAALLLVGDTYQIEAIGFGNWFSIIRNVLPDRCCYELTIPHRSPDEQLQRLWEEVRNMDDDNIVLEKMVRSDYSHPIDSDIFDSKSDDEIILCLNYNGLYGLNNINRLLQLNNSNPAVDIGVWRFKVGDPILFNDSGRFMLISLCQLILEGMLLTSDSGDYRLASFIDEQRMNRLYEKFILEYYAKECPQVTATASQIQWALDDGISTMLPVMQSDIMLTRGNEVLIIDAKYYTHTTQTQYDVHTLHSGNLYQIFTYVKNKEAEFGNEPHQVSGMLLYAATDEAIQPDNRYRMSGNQISVKTLDLNRNFSEISAQLNRIVEDHFL